MKTTRLNVGDVTIIIEDRSVSEPTVEMYAQLREAVRKISIGPDGRAPLVQSHEDALRVLNDIPLRSRR